MAHKKDEEREWGICRCRGRWCDAPTIQESDLQSAVIDAINFILGNRDNIIATL